MRKINIHIPLQKIILFKKLKFRNFKNKNNEYLSTVLCDNDFCQVEELKTVTKNDFNQMGFGVNQIIRIKKYFENN